MVWEEWMKGILLLVCIVCEKYFQKKKEKEAFRKKLIFQCTALVKEWDWRTGNMGKRLREKGN